VYNDENNAGNGGALSILTSRAGGLRIELGFAACRLLDTPSNGKPILIASCHPNRTIACQHQIRTRCLPMNAAAQRTLVNLHHHTFQNSFSDRKRFVTERDLDESFDLVGVAFPDMLRLLSRFLHGVELRQCRDKEDTVGGRGGGADRTVESNRGNDFLFLGRGQDPEIIAP
jgi:hypothetical protein